MIFLSNLRLMKTTAAAVKPDWLVSITDPGTDVPTPEHVDPYRHHTFRFHDLTRPVEGAGIVLPDRTVARAILDVLKGIPLDDTILIHCHAGISRSPAMVLAMVHLRWPDEIQVTARAFRNAAPWVAPNPYLAQSMDQELGTASVSDAIAEMGEPRMRGCMAAVAVDSSTIQRL